MLAELCIVLLGMGLFVSLCLPFHQLDESYYRFKDGYLLQQSISLAKAQDTVYEGENGLQISFNENGNVSHAETIYFLHHRIVVELGGGRIVEKE